jgi:hypothetical protein
MRSEVEEHKTLAERSARIMRSARPTSYMNTKTPRAAVAASSMRKMERALHV